MPYGLGTHLRMYHRRRGRSVVNCSKNNYLAECCFCELFGKYLLIISFCVKVSIGL